MDGNLTVEQLEYVRAAPNDAEQILRYMEVLPPIKYPQMVLSSESISHYDEHGTAYVKPPRNLHSNVIIRLMDWLTVRIDPNA